MLAALASGVLMYGVLLLLAGSTRVAKADPNLPPVLFYAASAACLFASMAWTRWRVRPLVPLPPETPPEEPPPTPDATRFQQQSLVSLALAEAAAVVGFVHGFVTNSGILDYLPYAAGALAVMWFDVLPLGLRFWRQVESRAVDSPIG